MKKLTDEEIQKIAEDRHFQNNLSEFSEADHDNLKMYSLLFEELKTQPLNKLPADFADNVIKKISRKKELIAVLKFHGAIVLLISLFVCVTIGAFAYAEVPYLNSILTLINQFKGALIFSLVCLVLIQVFDQLFVKDKIARFDHY